MEGINIILINMLIELIIMYGIVVLGDGLTIIPSFGKTKVVVKLAIRTESKPIIIC